MNAKKLVYKVGELHHLFFNRALPENARAGSMACYSGGILYHDRAAPAAAFLVDATGPDGKPAAVILPVNADGRWHKAELRRAVPESVHVIDLPDEWPGDRSGYASAADVRAIAQGHKCTSAAALCAAYTAAVDYRCSQAAHSATDAEGRDPVQVPGFVAAVRALLALRWNDAGAREYARAALQSVLDAWQLAPGGEYDRKTVQAIAQRRFIEGAAARHLPYLREYFSERARALEGKTGRARIGTLLNLGEKYGRCLPDAIAAVLRAGLPSAALAGLPVNMAGAFAADQASVARARDYLAAGRLAAAAWRDAIKGRAPSHAPNVAAHDPKTPRGARESLKAAIEYAGRKRDRDAVRARIEDNARALAAVADAWPHVRALHDQFTAGAAIDWRQAGVADAVRIGERLTLCSNAPFHVKQAAEANAAWCKGKNAALVWSSILPAPADIERAADQLIDDMRAFEKRHENELRADKARAALAGFVEKIENTPRQAARLIRGAWSDIATGWAWRDFPEELRAALVAEYQAATDQATARVDQVPAAAEFLAGGDAPDSGDWLRINGRIARTTRGAEVPTRAIRAAFAFIDAQPAGAADWSGLGFEIGAFQLLRRDESGAVVVGCHRFSAESVDLIRAQLAAADQATVDQADQADQADGAAA